MAEDKKTKQELEVQAKIANDFKLARNEADLALKASYSAEIQALLAECSKYNGVTQLTEVGKRLDKHLAKSGSLPSEFFRKELKQMPGWIPEHLVEDFCCTIDSITKWQASESYYRRTVRIKHYRAFMGRYFHIMNTYHDMGITEPISCQSTRSSCRRMCCAIIGIRVQMDVRLYRNTGFRRS